MRVPQAQPQEHPPEPPLWKRLGWMALIWAVSVATLGTVGWILRLWLSP